jgi:hypothetical protein
MLRRLAAIALALGLLGGAAGAALAQAPGADPQKEALNWKKQAVDTRAAVMSVAAELDALGDQGNAAARGMIDDALRWVGEGDKSAAAAERALEAGDFAAARNDYVAAWNHFVRAATSGLNAKRMLTGE